MNSLKSFKKLQRLLPMVVAGLGLAASSNLCYGADDIILGPQGTEASVSNPDGTWINMWGGAWVSTTFDVSTAPPTGDTAGSPYIQNNWPGPSAQDSYNMISPGTWWGNVIFNGADYSSIEMDIKYDTTSTITPTSAAHLEVGLDAGYSFQGLTNILFDTATETIANGSWHHVSIPIPATRAGIGSVGGVSFYQWNNTGVAGTMNFWMANVKVIARIVPIAPPTMSITTVKPGLNFIQGSISGQFDRQNIRTVNSTALTPISYTWVGAGHPVTYSFNISQWSAPDVNFHIYITPANGGETASDYNQTNVMIFQIGSQPPDGTIVNIFWKTNLPFAGTDHTELAATNTGSLLGTWQLQFTSDTAGAVIAPDATSYPFTVDPGLVAGLSGQVYISFGLNPKINSPTIVGESVIVSQIGIHGVGSLSSVATVTNDNFLADSVLDTNSWVANAFYTPSILFVPTNIAYSVDWTLPYTGFSLVANPTVTSWSTATDLPLPATLLTPGARVLVPKSSLPVGNSAFFALIKRSFTKLQVLLPGETNAPNTLTGKIGTPLAQSANNTFNVIVNAVDDTWHVVNSPADTIHLSSSSGNFFVINDPTDLNLSGGTVTFQVQFLADDAGTVTITATDTTDNTKTADTSTPFTN